ncbi:cyanate hydratase, partial [Rhodococcus hoagii]|nr:cyanate hydratase [Prescottella equi]
MIQSQFDPPARQAVAVAAVDAKTRKDLSWQQIADAQACPLAFTTAAVLGHTRCRRIFRGRRRVLGLDEDASMLLQCVPT